MRRLLMGMFAVIAAAADKPEDPERLLKTVMNAQLVDGDLRTAIRQYTKLAASPNRAVAARALVQLAECYRKLGDRQSESIYQQIVRDYADQKDALATARARLGHQTPETVRRDRVVWTGKEVDGFGRVSPDGRFISYVDWWRTGNLMLRDLLSGSDHALTNQTSWTDWTGNAVASTFSKDGKQLAYAWWTLDEQRGIKRDEVRIVNVQSSGNPQSRRVFVNADVSNISPLDWSPDGKWLAVHLKRRDLTSQIGLVGADDGTLRVLKSVDWRGPGKMFFSPDGRFLAYDLPASDDAAQRDVFVMAVDGTREIPAVTHSAHDTVMGWSPDGAHLLFASDRTGAIGLWTLPFAGGKPAGAPALLKPDIGSTSSLGLTENGTLHVFRDASTMSLQVVRIDLTQGKQLSAPMLQSFRSRRPDWSPDGKHLAYVHTAPNGIMRLAIRSADSGEVRELQPKLLYMNEPRWSPDARSLFTFGGDLKGRRGIYRIDAQTGATTFIVESEINRVQFSPDGKRIYYHHDFYTGVASKPRRIVEHNLETGAIRDVLRSDRRLGSPEISPDGRYLAAIRGDGQSRMGTLVLIPVDGGEPTEVFAVKAPESIAASGAIGWTSDSRAVIVAKMIGSRYELWLVPTKGGEPRKLDIDVSKWVIGNAGIRLHPDGSQIAFFTGTTSQEVWALENFLPAAASTLTKASR